MSEFASHLAKALSKLEKICTKYGKGVDTGMKESADKALHAARVTLAEYYIFQGLKQFKSDYEDGRAEVNKQIKAFSKAGIKPTKDLHKCLWKHATAMVKGQQLEA